METVGVKGLRAYASVPWMEHVCLFTLYQRTHSWTI